MYRTHVIAEAGNNHNGDLKEGFRLIDCAVDAGADSVKFQIIHPELLYLPKLRQEGMWVDNPVIQQRRAQELSHDDYRSLAAYCAEKEIGFSASIFDEVGLSLLVEIGVSYIKLASTDLNNIGLVRAASATGITVIISTGMSSRKEIERTVDEFSRFGDIENLVLMHCVSVYPTPVEIANISFIDELQQLSKRAGYSDHTTSSVPACMAVAKRVEFIEKHYTMNKEQEGFDHHYAMNPDEFSSYISDLRAAESALEVDEKLSEQERGVEERARRGIYFSKSLVSGTKIEADDILVVRPPSKMSADDIDLVLGRKLNVDVEQYESISADMLE